MTMRTSEKTVTFKRPFFLAGSDEMQPAGVYSVETDEELLEGVSFPAYRRTASWMRRHENPGRPGVVQTLKIDPEELDAALRRDAASADADDRAAGTGRRDAESGRDLTRGSES